MSVNPASNSPALTPPRDPVRPRNVNRSPIVIALLVANAMTFGAVVERLVYNDKSMPGIQIASTEVSGKSESALRTALATIAQRFETRTFTANVGTVQLEFNASDVRYKVDVERAIRAVQKAGRSGNPIDAIAGVLLRRTRNDEIALPSHFSQQAVDSVASQWVAAANVRVRNADVVFADAKATPVPPVPAPGIGLAATRTALVAALRDPNSRERITLAVAPIAPSITMERARQTATRANDLLAKTYQVISDTTKISLRGAQLVDAFRTTTTGDRLGLTIDTTVLRALINGRLDSEVSPPTDATFRVTNGSVEVVASKDGQGPDIDHIATEILAGRTTITAPLTTSHPLRDTAWAESLGIVERVSSFTSHHPCCPPRVTNIHKAADYLDGAVIEPGQVFSLNDLVGARTEARGFVSAPVFYGEFTEDFGGGVSQLATTTFNAAFWGGFEIIAHKPHSIYFDRYPMGREATVNYPSLDLKWRNNSKHGVLVTTSYNNNDITVALYGDREGKRVRETTDGCSKGPIFDTRDDPRCINVLATVEIEESELTCPVKNPSDDPNNECATLAAGERAIGAAGRKGYSVEYFRTITVEGQPPKVERFSWRYRMLANIVLIGDPNREPEVTTTTIGVTTTSGAGGSGSTTTVATPPKTTTSTTSG